MTGPVSWEFLAAIAVTVLTTGSIVVAVMRAYYKHQSDQSQGFDDKLKTAADGIVKMCSDTADELRGSIRGVHKRVNRVETDHRDDYKQLREDVKFMFSKHETHMADLFKTHRQKVEGYVKNGTDSET